MRIRIYFGQRGIRFAQQNRVCAQPKRAWAIVRFVPRSFALLVLFAVVLSGCGSESDPSTQPALAEPVASTETASAKPKASPAPAKPKIVAPPARVTAPKSQYGKLTVDTVRQNGAAADISGTTDLPDGSKVNLDLSLYTPNPDDTYVGNSKEAIVHDGRYSGTVSFPEVAGFAKGSHEVAVLFTPKAQTPDILAFVGQDGENLKGPNARKVFGFRTMEVKKRVRLRVAKRSVTMPNPSAYAFDDPRHGLAIVLADWKAKRWSDIVDNATLADDSSRAKLREMVDAQLGFRDLESASIGAVDRTGLIARITVEAAYSMGSELRKETMRFVMNRVDVHGDPDPNGRWRANLIGIGPGA